MKFFCYHNNMEEKKLPHHIYLGEIKCDDDIIDVYQHEIEGFTGVCDSTIINLDQNWVNQFLKEKE